MQHLNDDMDDLIRRAARDYPLSTGGADWAKVQKGLLAEEGASKRKRVDNRKYFFLLLLLPLGLVCNQYFVQTGEGVDQSAIRVSVPARPATAKAKQASNSIPASVPVQQEVSLKTARNIRKSISVKTTVQEPVTSPGSLTEDVSVQDMSEPTHFSDALENIDPILSSVAINIGEPGSSIKLTHAAFKPVKSEPVKEKRFYVAALGGADATTIKFQKMDRLSYHYGALLGLNIYQNWSIEAGVFATKKYYNSEGEYFSTDKIVLPPNTIIANVDGSCIMLEFPVNLKYDFNSDRPSKWFAAAGISSYMMKQEDYAYLYYYPNSGTSHKVYKTYENASDHLAAVLNLSAGYTRPLGKFASLRVEPSIGIPLKGVGVGSLPFTSGGLRLGLSKKLF